MRWRHFGTTDHERDLPPVERFWRRVQKTDDCWLWLGGRRGDGYGAWVYEGKQQGVHRLAYMLEVGPIPQGMVVMHSCDNPICVNPSHLSLGTPAENSADAAHKGRRLPGSRNHQAKLTEPQVISMRSLYDRGTWTQKELAHKFDVSPALVNHILNRKAWRHI